MVDIVMVLCLHRYKDLTPHLEIKEKILGTAYVGKRIFLWDSSEKLVRDEFVIVDR